MGAIKNSRAVILGAAPVLDWKFIYPYLQPDDFIICADGGRDAAAKLNLTPNWYVGDSDSGGFAGKCPADILPSEKDVTDLDMAVSRALHEGYREIILCGCTGGRQDHHFSAIGQLERLWRSAAHGILLDQQNEIQLLTPGETVVPQSPYYHYFGIVPLDAVLHRVTICGAKYEIRNEDIFRWSSLGVSNEPVMGKECTIQLDDGIGLLIRSN